MQCEAMGNGIGTTTKAGQGLRIVLLYPKPWQESGFGLVSFCGTKPFTNLVLVTNFRYQGFNSAD